MRSLARSSLVLAALLPWSAGAETPIDLRAEIAKAIAEARAETVAEAQAAPTVHVSPPSAHDAHAVASAPRPRARTRSKAALAEADAAEPRDVWVSMLQGNLRFAEGQTRTRETVQLRRKLAQGQTPRAVVLTCSDSRVPPELLFDQTLGDLFVVRNAGNVADPVVIGSIEYAVEHLGARLVVVLGHEGCGAVAAAASGAKLPSPNLEAVVTPIRPAIAALSTFGSSPAAKRLRVEANVHHSHDEILQRSTIVREAIESEQIMVMSAVYGLESGVVTRIDDDDAPPSAGHGTPTAPAHGTARAASPPARKSGARAAAAHAAPAPHASAAPASVPAPRSVHAPITPAAQGHAHAAR